MSNSAKDRSASLNDAPYPPMRPVIRSSLSSSPHYSPQFAHRGQIPSSSVIPPPAARTHQPTTVAGNTSPPPASEASSLKPLARSASGGRMQPALVQFCPSQHDLYACINCIPPTDRLGLPQVWKEPTAGTHTSSPRLKKPGPVLLELRRLQLVTDFDERQKGRVFQSSIVAVSRGNPQLGSNVGSTCLSFNPSTTPSDIPNACATGLTTGALCVHNVLPLQHTSSNSFLSSVEYFTPRHHRPATAVAWRPQEGPAHVAVGLGGTGSAVAGAGRRGGASRASSGGGGDREFCCLLWDVEAQSHSRESSMKGTTVSPLAKLSHGSGVSSLAWLQEGQTLAVGCQMRYVQLYDLRMSGNSSLSSSVWAHRESVNGIEVDPHRPNVFATFSRLAGEPIKLWDARNMETSLAEIKLSLNQNQEPSEDVVGVSLDSGSSVSAIKWSYLNHGRLSVAVGNAIQLYDTTAMGSRPMLTGLNRMGELPVLDMALQPMNDTPTPRLGDATFNTDSNTDICLPSSQTLLSELYQHRMLAVSSDRSVDDIPQHTKAPLMVSWRDGSLAHSLGRTIWIDSAPDSALSMNISAIQYGEDVSATMIHRARCLHTSRYSMDAVANMEMLAEEKQLLQDKSAFMLVDDVQSKTRSSLVQLWSWIHRVDVLCGVDEEHVAEHDDSIWPASGILDSGALTLLQMEYSKNEAEAGDIMDFSETLFCNTYLSPGRRATLASCGWTFGQLGLSDILAECEADGQFERAAALALWHDDIGSAIESLHRGADSIDAHVDQTIPSHPKGYGEALRLVAMCIAGYRGGDPENRSSKVWQRECSSLMQRKDLTGERKKNRRVAYLLAMCSSLIKNTEEGNLDAVLNDGMLSLCDRVAFACRFLDKRSLIAYLNECVKSCQDFGDIEGIVITGLEKQGFRILSAYVDKFADIQSAALVSGRVNLPPEWKVERAMASEWVDCYRSLLNTWQMWQSRAMFDVDRAERLRKRKGREGGNHQTPTVPIQLSVPAQIEARCNYCSMPLSGIRRQEAGTANQWLSKLSKQKSVLACCPRCRKPLPRCSVCLLSLGCLNPYTELTKERTSNLPFAEWFTWCMRCKHGGHAHHLIGWFANHETCPVSGCDCRCQFDGVKKIGRVRADESADHVGETSPSLANRAIA